MARRRGGDEEVGGDAGQAGVEQDGEQLELPGEAGGEEDLGVEGMEGTWGAYSTEPGRGVRPSSAE